MKKVSYLTNFLILVALTTFVTCSNKQGKTKDEATADTTAVEKSTAVCMYDYSVNGLQVLEDYTQPKSHVTFIKLGETVTILGKSEIDSVSKREYCNVELSDGTVGWSLCKYLIINATPAAVIVSTPVYERPDILTKSAKKAYDDIDIVAITEEKDGWCNVIGRNNLNSGWVLKDNLSTNKEDFDMAILARRDIYDSNGNIIDDKLNDFINNAPYPGSKIVSILRDRLIKNVENAAKEEPVEKESGAEALPE